MIKKSNNSITCYNNCTKRNNCIRCNNCPSCNNCDRQNNNYARNTISTEISCFAPAGNTGATGAVGENGLSAYELALQNGFVGTEQQWLNSLVGPTGPAGISKTKIPYYVNAIELSYSVFNGDVSQNYSNPGFKKDIYTESFPSGPFTDTINILEEDIQEFVAFSVPVDTTITQISGEYWGGGELGDDYFYIYLSLYAAPQNIPVFTLVNSSTLQLNPMFNTNTQLFTTNGKKDFVQFVPAGSKIALFAYILPAFEGGTSNDAYGGLMASITLVTE